MKSIIKILVSFMMMVMFCGILGCASVTPAIVLDVFQICDMVFINEYPEGIGEYEAVNPVFRNGDVVGLYIELQCVTVVDGQINITGIATLMDAEGVEYISGSFLSYQGVQTESWATLRFQIDQFPNGIYYLSVALTDHYGQVTATRTIELLIASGRDI